MELGEISERRRQRSSRRLRHEAEVKVFEGQAGSLDGIRKHLGLRPSQICEILKVHPSAWTRWTKTNRAPPHVYQMLEWYMEILQWRGQHHPIKDKPLISQSLRREDLDTYVPAKETEESVAYLEITARAQRLSRWVRILFGVWCFQLILWGIALTVLLKH
jgi:hypothetical protein